MHGLDIGIVGCGPCGLATAILLQRDGHRITLYERFDEPRPVGSGLMIQPTGLAILARIGLAAQVRESASRIDRIYGRAGRRTVLDVHYSRLAGNLSGYGIHRASLFSLLYEAARRTDVEIKTGKTVVGSAGDETGRLLLFADGETSDVHQLIVDASGARSRLTPTCGRELSYGALWATLQWDDHLPFDPHTLAQRYRRASVMAGILPVGRPNNSDCGGDALPQLTFFWSLRGEDYPRWLDRGLDAWKAEVTALWPECAALLDQIAQPAQLQFARYAHRMLPRPASASLVHIGDAWHSASPQLGQGANMALLDAWALATALREEPDVAHGIAAAIRLRRSHVSTYQRLSALFTPIYQSDSLILPLVRDRLVAPLSRIWPAGRIQAAMVAGLVGAPLETLGLHDT